MDINNFKLKFNILDRKLFFILWFALFLRILLLIVLAPWDNLEYINNFMTSDANGYYLQSLAILESGSFNQFEGYRTPIFPLFIAGIFQLFGTKIWIALLVQIGVDLINIYLVYHIAQNIFVNKNISIISAFLYSMSLVSIVNIFQLHTENIFVLFFNLFILLLLKFYKKQSINSIIYMGFIFGVTTLVRPITIYYPVIILLIFFYINIDIKSKIKYFLTFLIVFLVTISPWQLYNLINNDHYQLTTMQTHQLGAFTGQIKQYKQVLNIKNINILPLNKGHSQTMDNQSNWEKSDKESIKYIISNFPIFTLLTLKGVINIFIGTAKAEILHIFGYKMQLVGPETIIMRINRVYSNLAKEYYLSPLLLIKQGIEYIFAILGIYYMMFINKNRLELLTIIITIIYFVLLSGMFGYPRYKIPIIPLYLILSACGIFIIYKFFNKTAT